MTPSAFHVPPRPTMTAASVCGTPPPETTSSRLQGIPGEEAEGAAIGRPEGIGGPLGARQGLRRRRRQRPQPQAGAAVTRSHEHDLPAVGRERNVRGPVGGGRDDLGARLGRQWRRSFAQMPYGGDSKRSSERRLRRQTRPSTPAVHADADDVVVVVCGTAVSNAPSSASRTSPMSREALFRILLQATLQHRSERRGRGRRQPRPDRLLVESPAPASSRRRSSPSKARRRSASRTARRQRPRCRCACPPCGLAPARATCTPPCRGSSRPASSRAW